MSEFAYEHAWKILLKSGSYTEKSRALELFKNVEQKKDVVSKRLVGLLTSKNIKEEDKVGFSNSLCSNCASVNFRIR